MKLKRLHLVLRMTAPIMFVFVTGVFPLVVGPRHRINRETYLKIRLGMTQAEVETLLGVPPGDYGLGQGWVVDYGVYGSIYWMDFEQRHPTKWVGERMAIRILFDKNRGATAISADDVFREADSVLDWILRQVRLRPAKSWPDNVWWMTSSSGKTKSRFD
jgi:hypothetical protein